MAEPGTAVDLVARYRSLRARIRAAEQQFGRMPGSVHLVAVSKTRDAARIRAVAALGQRAFGENYVAEALPKIDSLRALGLEWHFIGHVQGNKCRDIADRFDWVHSVDRVRIARRLHAARSPDRAPLRILLQVNLQGETTKSGISPGEAAALARQVAVFDRLQLCGLMAIPAPEPDFERQRAVFARLRRLQRDLLDTGLPVGLLSMGMTDDLDAAIAEGATHVRVGTALFGPRPPNATRAGEGE